LFSGISLVNQPSILKLSAVSLSQSDGYDVYNPRNSQQPAYVPGDAFSPSSPAYGRYRQGPYATDGLESGRASTIGTDIFNRGPFNSSRTALNHDWRNTDLASQDGTTRGDEECTLSVARMAFSTVIWQPCRS
jgi:hypothetical protein